MKAQDFYESRDNNFREIPVLSVPKLTMKGLKLINEYHGLENVFVCEGEESLVRVLKLLNETSVPNFDLMIAYSEDGHVHPMKIERRGGHNNFILVDSVGLKEGVLSIRFT